MRYEAEKRADQGGMDTHHTGRDPHKRFLEVQGQEGDRLRVRVTYPGQAAVEKYIEIPSGKGKPADRVEDDKGKTMEFFQVTEAQ
jgi:hypothetical protein